MLKNGSQLSMMSCIVCSPPDATSIRSAVWPACNQVTFPDWSQVQFRAELGYGLTLNLLLDVTVLCCSCEADSELGD